MQPASNNQNFADAPPMVPGYELLRQIGRGGYGLVYLARRINDGAFFAAKIVYRQMFEEAEPYQREWAGIQNYKTLNCDSPFLLKVIDLFQTPDETFFCCVMELADNCDGTRSIHPESYKARTLKYELEKSGRRQRLSAKQCIEIGLALAQGLQTLHNNRLVHRDVKPSNILFVGGTPKLGDIGLVTDEEASLTKFTPHAYAAPEDEHATRADIYGFGKVLYEMCTGLAVDRFPSLPTTFKDWDDHALCLRLNRVIATACAVELRDRYASCGNIVKELEAIRDGQQPEIRSWRRWKLAMACLAIVAVAATAFWMRQQADVSGHSQGNTTVLSAISLIQVALPRERWAIPSSEQIAAARQRVIAQAKQRPVGASFAERHEYISSEIDLTRKLNDPSEVYAYLCWLEERCLADADHTTALRVADELSRRFQFDAREVNDLKADVMENTARTAATAWHWTGVGKGSTRLGFRFLAMDDFENANRMLRAAATSARRADNPLIGTNAAFLQQEFNVAEPWFQRISPYIVRFQSNSNDTEASTECGKYLCFAKNAWPVGLRFLQNADGVLSSVAQKELATRKGPDEAASLANSWFALANSGSQMDRRYFSERAARWYGVSLASQTNSELREILQKRRQQLLRQYPPRHAALRIAMKTAGHSKLVVTAQEMILTSSRGVEDVHVNWYRWGSFKAGGPEVYLNYGETRYLPAHVDFARAKVLKQHAEDSSTASKFFTYPDRIEIEIDESMKPATFEWEISL